MALVEEELPGVNKGKCSSYCLLGSRPVLLIWNSHKLILLHFVSFRCAVRSDFRVREDSAIAHKLQEQECKIQYIILQVYARLPNVSS